jgi:hypothetical protein
MKTTPRRMGLFWLAGWTMFASGLAEGRDLTGATELYSRGVHAYFAGRASEAESLLSRALELHDRDPRFHYFRALSLLQLGRTAEGRHDMAAGAELEAARPNRYAVGAALQRVQGSHRLLLERYRRDARENAAGVSAEVARQRAEQMKARDAGALRAKVVIPLDEFFRPGGPQPLSAEEVARRAAAAQQAPLPATPPAPTPPAPQATVPEDPFADDSSEAAAGPTPPVPAEPSSPAAAPSEEDAEENPFDF